MQFVPLLENPVLHRQWWPPWVLMHLPWPLQAELELHSLTSARAYDWHKALAFVRSRALKCTAWCIENWFSDITRCMQLQVHPMTSENQFHCTRLYAWLLSWDLDRSNVCLEDICKVRALFEHDCWTARIFIVEKSFQKTQKWSSVYWENRGKTFRRLRHRRFELHFCVFWKDFSTIMHVKSKRSFNLLRIMIVYRMDVELSSIKK